MHSMDAAYCNSASGVFDILALYKLDYYYYYFFFGPLVLHSQGRIIIIIIMSHQRGLCVCLCVWLCDVQKWLN